jgi:hypothetical protein
MINGKWFLLPASCLLRFLPPPAPYGRLNEFYLQFTNDMLIMRLL